MARLTARRLAPMALAMATTPAWAGGTRLAGGGSLDVSLGRIVSALVLCLMLAGVAALLLKRSGGKVDLTALRSLSRGAVHRRRITIIETRRVSQHGDVCLFRCDGMDYLVLSSSSSQQVLRTTAAGPDAES